ncbi:MAG TPA: hypothetical protein DIT89_11110 [Planctomycetaceae bacterium]|nr:hypothetical protein [Planctomycetaceae bacterium]
MAPSETPPAPVWLLILDSCPLPSTEPPATQADQPLHWHPFDDLDCQSLCFEQYYSQNPAPETNLADYLGGPAACSEFQTRLSNAAKSCQHISLRFPADCGTKLPHGQPWLTPSPTTALPSTEQNSTPPDLLILSANGCESFETLTEILKWILQQRTHCTVAGCPPTLIVTALQGVAVKVPQHFTAACSEALIHVPLWILSRGIHSARLQTLCGSHDLLPTIAQLLSLPPLQNDHCPAPDDVTPPALLQTPVSLLCVRELHPEINPRLLTIAGGEWVGLRTQHYFLVHPVNLPNNDDVLQTCSLYQKPDDFWNVNNSIVACEEIARAMLAAASQQH